MKAVDGMKLLGWGVLFGIFMTLVGIGVTFLGNIIGVLSSETELQSGMGWLIPWVTLKADAPVMCACPVSFPDPCVNVCGFTFQVVHNWNNFGLNVLLFGAIFMAYKILKTPKQEEKTT